MTTYKFIKSYDEVSNIRTFVFEAAGATWQPGQYQLYTLPQIEGQDEARQRYFTIASAPSEGEIHISTRVTDSDFKQTLNRLQPGDTIEGTGIEGDFVWTDDQPVVLIAGGIGVTPYRAMIVERARAGTKINAHLVYYGRDESFAFHDEFDAIAAKHPELKISYIVGESISADGILGHAPEVADIPTYLSGPEPMVEAVGEDLKSRGVKLLQDWFPGYTDQTY